MISKAGVMYSFNESDFDSNCVWIQSVFLSRVFIISLLIKQMLTSVVIPQLPFIKEYLFESQNAFYLNLQ